MELLGAILALWAGFSLLLHNMELKWWVSLTAGLGLTGLVLLISTALATMILLYWGSQ